MMSALSTALAVGACAAFCFIADLVYAVDHYLVHHDRQRYRLTSHDIRIGMRWMLSDGGSYAAPPPAPFFSGPPPGPLVRKY